MTIPELRAMLEVLNDEDFRAVLPLERCNSSYVRLMDRVVELEAAIYEIRLMSVPAGYDPGNQDITKVCKRVLP